MNQDDKVKVLDELRKAFIAFMSVVHQLPGAIPQKQHAFVRLDEGHMWLQNSILSYTKPEEVKEEKPKRGRKKVAK